MPDEKIQKPLSKRDEILLKFMAMTIEKINTCYANNLAMQTLMIKKGYATMEEILEQTHDTKMMPQRKIGRKVLSEIMDESFVDRLSQMIDIPE
jgi:hypothetical protein